MSPLTKTMRVFTSDERGFSPSPNLPKETPIVQAKGKNIEDGQKKIGRNDPCPCGSGKKYKKCCGQN